MSGGKDSLARWSALAPCESCGAPTDDGVCAFCRLAERATAAQPVRFTDGPRR